MKKTLGLSLILFFACPLLSASGADNRTSVAVYPLKAVGAVDKSLAATVTSLLGYELSQSPKLIYIREDMLKTVMERQAQNISDACDSTMCQVEIGKLVQCQKMVVGDLSKLGSLYILTVNIIDVKTGAVENTFKEKCACSEDQLEQLAAAAGNKIRGYYGESSLEVPPPPPAPPPGSPSSKKYQGPVQGQEYRPGGEKGGPMVVVPAGEFLMGCNDRVDDDCHDDEKPYHKVYLDAFHIDKLEVTQGDYDQCVSAGNCRDNKKYDGFTGARQPVVGVDWNDAKSYCEWAGKRLPTEAQWEKAARGTNGRKYPWGNQTINCSLANYSDCNKGKAVEVGGYASGASPYGALDMMGNAWEWVADRFDKGYYSSSPERNPKGASSGTSRVLRGGGWGGGSEGARAAYRSYDVPALQNNTHGFRCVGD